MGMLLELPKPKRPKSLPPVVCTMDIAVHENLVCQPFPLINSKTLAALLLLVVLFTDVCARKLSPVQLCIQWKHHNYGEWM